MTVKIDHNWFYVPPEHISKTHIVFPKDIAHYAYTVLRKKEQDTIVVTDGQGNIFMTRANEDCAQGKTITGSAGYYRLRGMPSALTALLFLGLSLLRVQILK